MQAPYRNEEQLPAHDVGEEVLGYNQAERLAQHHLQGSKTEKRVQKKAIKEIDDVTYQGVNLAVERFLNSPHPGPDGQTSMMLSDGMGTGKTNQALLTAGAMAEKLGAPGLVVTRKGLVPAFEKRAKELGLQDVEIISYEQLASKKGKPYAAVALDEGQDIAKSQDLKKALSSIKTKNTLFLSGTPYTNPQEAHYFVARLQGRSEADVARELGGSLKDLPRKLEALNKQFYKEGSLARRDYPLWGEMGGVKAHALSPDQSLEQEKLMEAFSGQLEKAGKDEWAQEKVRNDFQKEAGALSDEALVDHAARWVMQQVREGKKVVLYGNDQPVQSSALRDANGRPREFEPFLSGVKARLKEMKKEEGMSFKVAQLKEPPEDGKNTRQMGKFVDEKVRDKKDRPLIGDSGDPVVDFKSQVLLMPYSQSAGYNKLNQRSREGMPVVVASGFAKSADDQLQIAGRGSRRSNAGPTQVVTLAMDSVADHNRAAAIEPGMTFLKASGSTWAAAYEGISNRYQQECQHARKQAVRERGGQDQQQQQDRQQRAFRSPLSMQAGDGLSRNTAKQR